MKITLAELQVMLDACLGSACILDRRDMPLFRFTADQRRQVANDILARMSDVAFELEEEVTHERA